MPDMDNLKVIRKTRKLTQAALADLAGVDQGYISKLERGEANITLDKIYAVAAALKVRPAMLFTLSDLQHRALGALEDIDPDRREAALQALELMAGHKGRHDPQ